MVARPPPVVTVDGPGAAGKGTLCKIMAKSLRWHILDSGAIYRVLALLVLKYNLNTYSEYKIAMLATHMNVNFIFSDGIFKIIFEGENIKDKLYSSKITEVASKIAMLPTVRIELSRRFRMFRKAPGLVADGRDMGTVVFPDAIAKIFLNASQKERAKRRMLQLRKNSFNINIRDMIYNIKKRDNYDYNRALAPLTLTEDMFIINSTKLSIEQVSKKALQYIHKKLLLYNTVQL